MSGLAYPLHFFLSLFLYIHLVSQCSLHPVLFLLLLPHSSCSYCSHHTARRRHGYFHPVFHYPRGNQSSSTGAQPSQLHPVLSFSVPPHPFSTLERQSAHHPSPSTLAPTPSHTLRADHSHMPA